jgi:thioredoxin-related protein
MKKIGFTFLLLIASLSTLSQNWVYNIDKAKEIATNEDKLILLVFSGSDWCAPCIKLEKKIWKSEQFQELSEKSFVMIKADFPRRKNNKLSKEQQLHNDHLAENYNKNGSFPLVVLLDKNLRVKGRMGYKNISPVAYYNKLNSLN